MSTTEFEFVVNKNQVKRETAENRILNAMKEITREGNIPTTGRICKKVGISRQAFSKHAKILRMRKEIIKIKKGEYYPVDYLSKSFVEETVVRFLKSRKGPLIISYPSKNSILITIIDRKQR